MREILLRGKRIDTGEWFVGCDFWTPWFRDNNFATLSDHENMVRVDLQTIGQYTGVKDKNGVMIFEGDIVKYKYAYGGFDTPEEMRDGRARVINDCVSVVKFENGRFLPMPHCDICDDYWYSSGAFDFEVIGNIYDNPELIKM